MNENYLSRDDGEEAPFNHYTPKLEQNMYDYSSLTLPTSYLPYQTEDNLMNPIQTGFHFPQSGSFDNYGGKSSINSSTNNGRLKKRKIKSLGSIDSHGSNENLVYLENTTAAGVLPSYPINGGGTNGAYQGHNNIMKRRFVWPQTLHQDFIGAVFDIGLRYANPRDVLTFMNNSSASTNNASTGLNQDLLRSQILKYQLYRDQRFFPRPFFYDLENTAADALLYSSNIAASNDHNPNRDYDNGADTNFSSSSSQKIAMQNSSGDYASSSGGRERSSNPEQQRTIDKLERECKELLKLMNNQFIKIEFLMKLENDMTQEMNELIQKQNQRRQSISQQLALTLNNHLPSSQAFAILADSVRENLPSLHMSVSNSSSVNPHSNFVGITAADMTNRGMSHDHNIHRIDNATINNTNAVEKDASMAEILAAKYRSIMEMKDHIKLHRVLLQKHDSQIHGYHGSPESQSNGNNVGLNGHGGSISLHQSQPASVDFDIPAAHNDMNHGLHHYSNNYTTNDGVSASNQGNQNVVESPNDLKWLDDSEEDLFSFLLEQ